jgi:aryl-alcohol dehydrogenase-like predicted oxidoreductase
MKKISLGNTGRETTVLGFGGSSLMGALNRKQSLAMLESAFDAGIRHFDVAPMYGYGEAEACLGDFLERHRADVTVTTKYGIPAAKNSSMMKIARRIVGPVVKALPGIKQRLARVASAAASTPERASFTAEQARASLESSLAQLRTDRIDVWLLHEVEASDLKDDGLLRFLEDQVKQGTVGTFGVGSEGPKVDELVAFRPAYCSVLQYEWSVLDPAIPAGGPFRIHHRALTSNFRAIHATLTGSPSLLKRWSDTVGVDLAEAGKLASLMLKASLVSNPASVILFSSKAPGHIQSNVRTAMDASLDAPARQLHQLVLSERSQLQL